MRTWLEAAGDAPVTLREMRRGLRDTQSSVARRMGSEQTEISKIERRKDHKISTLRRYVEALGGKLEVAAVIGVRRFVLKV